MITWIDAKLEKPKLSDDEFDKNNNRSDKVLCYTNDKIENFSPYCFGVYHHFLKKFLLEGRGGKYIVTHWTYINEP